MAKKKTPIKNLLKRRSIQPKGGSLLIGAIAVVAAVVATVVGFIWRALAGEQSESGLGDSAILTADSVMNATQAHVIEAVESANQPHTAVIERAARDGVRESALAGADITAAAVGAVRGARDIYESIGLSRDEAIGAAFRGATDAAASIGPVAERRVRETLTRAASRG